MSEWREVRLESVLEVKYGKDHKELQDGLVPCYGTGGIMRYVNNELYAEESILIPRKGSLNNIYYINEPFWTVDTLFWTKINKDQVVSKFLFYQLTLIDFTILNVGSAVPSLTVSVLNEIDISLPPLPEQKAIAEVLSSLDDKIDLLHRQNKTLEQMAETLFRQWFVVEAGEDWEEVELKKLCKVITKGTTPTSVKRSFVESGINFIKVNCIDGNGGFLLDKFNYIDEGTHNSVLKRSILEEGDILYSIAGTIGRTINVTKDILPANVNQALAIIRVDKNIINPLFIKYSLNDKDITFNLHSKIVHAVQPNLSLGEIGGTILSLPNKEALERFDTAINPMDSKIKENQTQIRTLQSLRDTLLPKLMSGEVRIASNG